MRQRLRRSASLLQQRQLRSDAAVRERHGVPHRLLLRLDVLQRRPALL
jgi:hypothetical protein